MDEDGFHLLTSGLWAGPKRDTKMKLSFTVCIRKGGLLAAHSVLCVILKGICLVSQISCLMTFNYPDGSAGELPRGLYN